MTSRLPLLAAALLAGAFALALAPAAYAHADTTEPHAPGGRGPVVDHKLDNLLALIPG
ncbi:hypothetical protein ACIO3O_12885 [Streptomyces sp. NPDC087440]|uniref:hypothetical protein n=1 Tax=Streptomyces sp. NPDC087440 TaxID=3365790 RepID=UPI0038102285